MTSINGRSIKRNLTVFNPRTYKLIHTPTVVQVGLDGTPLGAAVAICKYISFLERYFFIFFRRNVPFQAVFNVLSSCGGLRLECLSIWNVIESNYTP